MRYSVRLFVCLVLAVSFIGCEKEVADGLLPYQERDVELSEVREIQFYSDDAETKGTGKLSSVPNNINVIMSEGTTETAVWSTETQVFSKNSSGKYVHNPALYWPGTEPTGGYHFYATNADVSDIIFTSDGVVVKANAGRKDDIMCAYNATPGFRSEYVQLPFEHIFAVVGNVSLSGFGSCSDIRVNLKYKTSGRYNLKTKQWSDLSSTQSKDLTVSSSSNDLWIVPGQYVVTVTFKDALGSSKTFRQNYTFQAGTDTNITVKLGMHGDVVISFEDNYMPPYFDVYLDEISAGGGYVGTPEVYDVRQDVMRSYVYAGGGAGEEMDTVELSEDEYTVTYSIYEDGPFSDGMPSIYIPSLGTRVTYGSEYTGQTVYVKVTDGHGNNTVRGVDVYQEANQVVRTDPAYTTTTGFSITLNPSTVNSTASTSTVSGTRTYSSTTEKKTYTSGAVSGGTETTGLTQTITSGISVTASPMTGITSISGVTISVGANSSTTNDRTWTIYGTYDSKQGSATLTQLKSTSWDFGGDDEHDPGSEEGNI